MLRLRIIILYNNTMQIVGARKTITNPKPNEDNYRLCKYRGWASAVKWRAEIVITYLTRDTDRGQANKMISSTILYS